MTKYKELIGLAQTCSKRFFDDRDDAASEIRKVVDAFTSYLGMPGSKIEYAAVNRDFDRSGDSSSTLSSETLCQFEDGFWGCIVLTEYGAHPAKGGVVHISRLAVKRQGSSVLLRLSRSDKNVEHTTTSNNEYEPFVERWFECTKLDLASELGGHSRNIGFT